MNIEKTKRIKRLLFKCKSLKENMNKVLDDRYTNESGRYSSFKTFAEEHKYLAEEVFKVLDLKNERIPYQEPSKLKGWADTTWPYQKNIIESLVLYTDTLISFLEEEIDFAEDEYDNLENFIKTKLRCSVFDKPEKEIEIQNIIENLFIGKCWSRGVDYDRESGKFVFSGREYIPDFIVPKLNLCIEVKLLKEKNRKSKLIEEINADITAYSKAYSRQIYVVYDLGILRDELEFRRDLENAKDDIKVIIVKH